MSEDKKELTGDDVKAIRRRVESVREVAETNRFSEWPTNELMVNVLDLCDGADTLLGEAVVHSGGDTRRLPVSQCPADQNGWPALLSKAETFANDPLHRPARLESCLICGDLFVEVHTMRACRDALGQSVSRLQKQHRTQTAAHSVWQERAHRYKAQRDEARAQVPGFTCGAKDV